MLWWDDQLLEVMERMNLKVLAGARYMDDIRMWLRAIRLGWRVTNGVLQYKEVWKLEEQGMGLTELQKTTSVLKDIMNSV